MLAHIENSEAGRLKYEPVLNSLFRLTFLLPDNITPDERLTEHAISVTGFRDVGVENVQQQSFGAKRNYASTDVDNTQEIEITMSLNLNKTNQNYVYKKIREWHKAAYNSETGEYGTASEYMATLIVERLDKKGNTISTKTLKDAWVKGDISGIDDYDITNHEPIQLAFTVIGNGVETSEQ
ncbi:hypothetical protein BPT24_133 [Tenacibaculum phage pT24]|uniref:Uncharacterized protein n=1 Tax=Tenacibaculum phage pT24 TaxID=1880590 RepID=A0A1B4XWS5_9CAUD|nr:hypothetical protein HYP10_gp133 [Tenacibaculum phage pT24]BAV39258.1 hypothetical protein BPT24_133 [Tenacibaculum phage pT24]